MANDLHADILEQSQRVSDFLDGKRADFIANFQIELRSLHADFRTARELSSDDTVELSQLDRQKNASERWHRLARRDVERIAPGAAAIAQARSIAATSFWTAS